MEQIDYRAFIPGMISGVASIFAAIAAIGAWKASRNANDIAKQTALANHHHTAADALTKVLIEVKSHVVPLTELASEIWHDWPRDIEALDERCLGGKNPRPLRHVLADASKLLYEHSSQCGEDLKPIVRRKMYTLARDGVPSGCEEEYTKLLQQADGSYASPEDVFGFPPLSRDIRYAPAFRWSLYQLQKRVKMDKWFHTWLTAWEVDGRLRKFRELHDAVSPELQRLENRLTEQKFLLAQTTWPLSENPVLEARYSVAMEILRQLREDCSIELLSHYRERDFSDEAFALVTSALGFLYMTMQLGDRLTYLGDTGG